MKVEKTCIVCPVGCSIVVEYNEVTKKIETIEGTRCKRGADYITQELVNPMRTIQSSILVIGGELPLASVKTSSLVPKGKIFKVMELIKSVEIKAPVTIGDIVIENILDLKVDVVVTKSVAAV